MDTAMSVNSLPLVFIMLVCCWQAQHVAGQHNVTRIVCRGTALGIAHSEDLDANYKTYRLRYANCTYVDGNLELVFLNKPDVIYDLSFLKDIREVTGYVLIVTVMAKVIPLTQLQVIRGRTLYDDKYSLFVSLNYNEHRSAGLTELQLSSLHEIAKGNVSIKHNRMLCFVDTINWQDIIHSHQSVYINETSSSICERCHDNCEGHCWGSGLSLCQTFTKLSCSTQCGDNRCMGPQPRDCCHRECAAGCTGPTSSDCFACQAFDNNGRCEPYCPPEVIYSEKEFKQVPNPDAKYTYGTLCVDKCPKHLIADRGACVTECPSQRMASPEGKCVECDGPCPKECPGNDPEGWVTFNNINNFTGCTIIKGSIRIYSTTVQGEAKLGIPPMNVANLSVFETVKEITDYLQIQLNDPRFVDLDMFRNLEVIHGRQLTGNSGALEITHTSLKSLNLNSLKEIRNGGITVTANENLCYADGIDWERFRSSNVQKIYVRSNRNSSLCAADGEVCSSECSSRGCWGPRDDQCLSCAHFSLGKHCLPSCTAVGNIFMSGPNTCEYCNSECINGCTDKEADSCAECRHFRNGPFCVPECPATKYADNDSVCQPCHENCGDAGCTGPLNSVGPGACKSCDVAVFDEDGRNVTECLSADTEDCEVGYYKLRLSLPDYGPLEGKYGCKHCHPMCRTCDEYGLSYCKTCLYYRQEDRCVSECGNDYYLQQQDNSCRRCDHRCVKCNGPSAYNCTSCKHYTMYSDLGKGEEGTLPFNCTEKCPNGAPFTYILEKENGYQVTLCVAEDYTNLGHKKAGMIAGVITVSIVIVSIVVIAVVVMCRQRAVADRKKIETAARLIGVESEMQPLQLSGIEPDLAVLRLAKQSELKRGSMIGAGAFGSVYRGWWIPENESVKIPVAIKVLSGDNITGQSTEMLDEARIMASVNHKYCVRILAICMAEQMMIITQLMSCGCLRNYVKDNRERISSQVMLNWCTQIAKGMEYLEKRGIIHRDLAARNILVQRPEHVRITDFGLAKLLGNSQELCSTSPEKMPIKWLALECIRSRVYSHKSDVWSYGVMLWELFTFGETPYSNTPARDIPSLLEKGERLPQPTICTIDVFMLMIKCWVLDADTRPSFRELADQFEKMAMDPGRYLVIEGDSQRRLMSCSSDHESEARDLLRMFSLPDGGNESIVTAEEYLQPRSNGATAAVANPLSSTPSRTPSSLAESDSCRRRSRRFPFRHSNSSASGRGSLRYTSDPCKKSLTQQQQEQTQSPPTPATPAVHQYPPLDFTDSVAVTADGDDNIWVKNNNYDPSSQADLYEGSRHRSHVGSTSNGVDEYLTPRSPQSQPAYLDFVDDGAAPEEDVDLATSDADENIGYVHMSPQSAGTFASNPEYFEDSVFGTGHSSVNNGSLSLSRNHGVRAKPSASDYYNCPPEVPENRRHLLERQSSRV